MDSRPRASASVVAAGVVAIIGGGFAAFSILASLLLISRAQFPASGPSLPSAMRPILYGTWIFFLLCAAFVMVSGVQVIRLRNWARIALLVVAGCLLFFGVVGIGVIFSAIYLAPADPAVSKPLLVSVLAFVYGIPVIVALWWLILFTRRSVADQFLPAPVSGTTPGSSTSRFNNPQCPLAVRIVGWYLASFVLFLPFLPFLPVRIPAYYFGRVFHGPAAMLIFIFNFGLLAVPGIGLLLLKRWSFPLAIASQLLICLNGAIAAFSPSFESSMRSMMAEVDLPALPSGVEQLFSYIRYFNLFGLVLPLAILITLYLSRRSFYSAASASGQPQLLS